MVVEGELEGRLLLNYRQMRFFAKLEMLFSLMQNCKSSRHFSQGDFEEIDFSPA